jgi:hypothetical protein
VMRRPQITSHSASRNSPMNVTVETWVQERTGAGGVGA